MIQRTERFRPNLEARKLKGAIAYVVLVGAVAVGIIGLGVLLLQVFVQGVDWLRPELVFNFPSRFPEQAGLKAALFGTLWLMGLTALFCVPIGIGAAIYLEEYAPENRLTQFIEINIANLAGVPSIVYGLLGLALFVHGYTFEYGATKIEFNLGRSVLAGALTMSLLVLPIVILASREAIKAVPDTYRQASFALGATKWETIRGVVLPSAFPGMLTGIILAMSRAVGETAPVIAISALVYLTFIPQGPLDRFTVLPIQIYNWVSRPQADFQGLAAGGIVVLLIVLLSMNALAVFLRNKFQSRSIE
ncbi:MAG: phosphate ABC transporter permease PstA [Dehalococcoidia bacterium]|nr:phosphate ABC transporter permease PstA [Dehalococcoidia bacterium]